jgi:hypothetical protein
MFCKNIIKTLHVSVFRSLLHDYPQGSSFVLSALNNWTKQTSGEVVMH